MRTRYLEKKYLEPEIPTENISIASSHDSYLIDENGKKYIDFFMGWCVGNTGWGNEEITDKIKSFKGPTYVFPGYHYKGWAELSQLLAEITPGKLQKSFRATGGTEAVEFALQMAMSYTKRHKFVSIEGSYHGHSLAALSIGASDFREWYSNLLPDCYKVKAPLNDNAIVELENYLKNDDIAAFIMEPIVCNLGVEIPTQEFMTKAEELCRKHGTLLIIDEVATGFNRTGKLFGVEHFGIEPDIMVMAKAITGGHAGMGATIAREEVANAMNFDFSSYSTYGWHPLSTEAAIANIKYHQKNQKQIETHVQELGSYFLERLSLMQFKEKAKVHGIGLALGVTFSEPGYSVKIVHKALEKGVLVCQEPDNKTFTLFPALNIKKEVAKEGLDILEKCL